MSHTGVTPGTGTYGINKKMAVRTSDDMLHWSDPAYVMHNGKEFGNHYVAIYPNDAIHQPNVLDGDEFSILSNHNGTDVMRYAAKIVSK
jgi:hypothetical protein